MSIIQKFFVILTIALLGSAAGASTCFKLDETKSDAVPSYIWLLKEICFENFAISSDATQTQIEMSGAYEIRTTAYPHFIHSQVNSNETYPTPYRGYYRVFTLNLDNSASRTHYWRSRAMIEVRGDLAKPTLQIRSDVHEIQRSSQRGYKVVYSMSESQ